MGVTVQPDRLLPIVEGVLHHDAAECDNAAGDWRQVILARIERTGRQVASMPHTFVTGYGTMSPIEKELCSS